jgi:DNA-binding NarL/FixJ family response regulator
LLATDFDVIATVHNGRSLIQAAVTLKPEVILTDISMPQLNGLHAAERIKRILPAAKVLYVTVNQDPDIIAKAFRYGASGYVLKTSGASELVTAIRCILQGERYLTPALATTLTEPLAGPDGTASSRYRLTDRQIEVLQLLAEGRSMKEAAAALNLTTRTVAFHKYRIMDTLSLDSDAEVVRYAMREHIVFA